MTQMCEKYPLEPAICRYLWEWGETGFAGSTHVQELTQLSQTLGRTFTMIPIPIDPTPPPLGRDERTQLIAARMSVEAELEDLRRSEAVLREELSNVRAELRNQLSRARALEGAAAEAESRREAAESEAATLRSDLDAARERVATLTLALDEAPSVVKFVEG